MWGREGVVGLDSPVVDLLAPRSPPLPAPQWRPRVTLWHLETHTAGFPREAPWGEALLAVPATPAPAPSSEAPPLVSQPLSIPVHAWAAALHIRRRFLPWLPRAPWERSGPACLHEGGLDG